MIPLLPGLAVFPKRCFPLLSALFDCSKSLIAFGKLLSTICVGFLAVPREEAGDLAQAGPIPLFFFPRLELLPLTTGPRPSAQPRGGFLFITFPTALDHELQLV